jgi:RNA polymerase sigma-70 factor (ECF subfamily)
LLEQRSEQAVCDDNRVRRKRHTAGAGGVLIHVGERAAYDRHAAQLVEALKAGDPDAFDDLYRLYLKPLYGYMVVALHDHHEAEDAAHEVFVKMLLALPRYELRDVPFRAWLFRIARNHVLDRLQQLRRVDPGRPAEVLQLLDDGLTDSAATTLLELSDDDFLRVIQFLPLMQRQVLVLRYVFDLSFAEIAIALHINDASARNLQRRAFAKLRPRLAHEHMEATEWRMSRLAMRLRPAPRSVLSARLGALV